MNFLVMDLFMNRLEFLTYEPGELKYTEYCNRCAQVYRKAFTCRNCGLEHKFFKAIKEDYKEGDYIYVVPGRSIHIELLGKIFKIQQAGNFLVVDYREDSYGLSRDEVIKVCCENCVEYTEAVKKHIIISNNCCSCSGNFTVYNEFKPKKGLIAGGSTNVGEVDGS